MNKLWICGCRGSIFINDKNFSKYGYNTSCYLNIFDDKAILVDCGSGVSNAINELKKYKEINLLITHLHFDHIVGIVTLVTLCKDSHINIYGKDIKDGLCKFMGKPYWPISVGELKNVSFFDIGDEFNIGSVNIKTMESNHPGGCTLYRLSYDNKSIVFAFDFNHNNGYDSLLKEFSKNANILLYDGNLKDDEYLLHPTWGHSTVNMGVKIANEANVNKLIITHHNYLYDDFELEKQEKNLKNSVNKDYSFAKEHDVIEY